MADSRRSRDPDRWRRQLAGLARNNPRLQARLDAGELPGFAGPLEGTEHLEPEAAAAAAANPTPPPPAPAAPPAPDPTPAPATRPALRVGSYQEPDEHPPTPAPQPDRPGPGPEPAEPAGPPEPAPAAPRRGPLGQFADGFLGRV